MKKIFLLFHAVILSSCVNNDDYNIPNLNCTETSLIKTIEPEDIQATEDIQEYINNDIIEAYVTSSDESGNFYKTLSLQTLNGSLGFSMSVDATATFINYEPGRKVLIKLQGTYNRIYNGSLQIGDLGVYNGFASIQGLSPTEYSSILNRSCTVVDEEVLVQHVTLAEIHDDSLINKLIEIDNVQFINEAVGNTFYNVANDIGGGTNYMLTDESGNTLVFRTSSFASFAGDIVLENSGKIRGVLTKYGNTYQFIIRTLNDLQLTEERF